MDRIPEMRDYPLGQNLDNLARTGLDESVEVLVDEDHDGTPVATTAAQIGLRVTGRIMAELGIRDQSLRRFGSVIAQAALYELAQSDGFEIVRGPSDHPVERVHVQLGRPDTIQREAEVTRNLGEQ